MYISNFYLITWVALTVGAFGFGFYSRFQGRRHRSALRRARKTLQKLESKNGKLWYEVMKSRAASGEILSNEITLTNVTNVGEATGG